VPLKFAPLESYFVVFRSKARGATKAQPSFAAQEKVLELAGPWEVAFDPKYRGPEKVEFDALEDWTVRQEPEIKYYSGRATYTKSFEWNAGGSRGDRVFVDLGTVHNMARVKLNGRDLGVVWCAPWQVEITSALRPGRNELQVEVANLWINRLIQDSGLPEAERLTWTSRNPYKPDSKLSPSGLLGPVRVVRQESIKD
jgi:hypothetical protein